MADPVILDYAAPVRGPGIFARLWQWILGFLSGLLIWWASSSVLLLICPTNSFQMLAIFVVLSMFLIQIVTGIVISRRRTGKQQSFWHGFALFGFAGLGLAALSLGIES